MKEKIGEQYLIPLVYHTDNPGNIIPENLPDFPLIIKTNHGCSGHVIVKDKSKIDWKSVQKNFLPQSSSDFIYAIIVEEYGLIGAVIVILMYFLLLFRILIAAKKATTIFATLLIIGVGLPIIFQAMINMAVAVNILPVTGQTLPLISSGGTSIWMTCFAIGIILSVTAEKEKEISTNEEHPLDILHEAIG